MGMHARMHAPGKGLSQSALPYRRSLPTWLKLTSGDVKEQIFKLAKKGSCARVEKEGTRRT
uniref:Small ribosomal subunit protein uS15 N-terminal domain-containing protein n=1 Tax=Sparus aurata TaxID=8175 RepID=A0A671TVX8_SPAAU